MAGSNSQSKSKSTTKPRRSKKGSMPKPPIFYINAPSDQEAALASVRKLITLLPDEVYVMWPLDKNAGTFVSDGGFISSKKPRLGFFIDNQPDASHVAKFLYANVLSGACVKYGRSFHFINLHTTEPTPANMGPHLTKFAFPRHEVNITDLDSSAIAECVLKALFKALTPMETLYLISPEQLRERDTKHFANYAYCPISEVHKRSKKEQIQIVAVVITKPVISPEGNKLTWTVADKTGIANFYFLNRAETSQFTWNWVLNLKPGQRVALPRMPCVEIKECTSKRILKAPFRLVGGSVALTGDIIVGVGRLFSAAGGKMTMGQSKEWVPRVDAARGVKSGRWMRKPTTDEDGSEGTEQTVKREVKVVVKVWDEKGMVDVKCEWKKEDEDASTDKGSVGSVAGTGDDEKKAASFV